MRCFWSWFHILSWHIIVHVQPPIGGIHLPPPPRGPI